MKPIQERWVRIRTRVPVHIPTADGKGIVETLMVEVEADQDPKDGEIYLHGETLAELDRIKARHMGILLPAEIRELRERLQMTQAEMGDLLGIGEKSYSRWETGRGRLSHSINKLFVALWEGRLTVADLQAMRQPAFAWFERVGDKGPCGSECQPQVIEAHTAAMEDAAHEALASAA